jgi:HAD superfamily hydrolase (TIGR01662 family)
MLYLFDIDGTLVRSFMREGGGGVSRAYDLVEMLPGRRDRIQALEADGHDIALVTNQGGVAFGYQTLDQVLDKMGRVLDALGLLATPIDGFALCVGPNAAPGAKLLYLSLHHPQATIEQWRTGVADDWAIWRKPGGGMLLKAIADRQGSAETTVFVGDMDSDRAAADAAGVRYQDAAEFFGPARA